MAPGLTAHRRLQNVLALLAVAAAFGTMLSGRFPSAADYLILLACAGLIAIGARFPVLTAQAELPLISVIGISVLFVMSLAPAALVTLAGLLLGEVLWFLVPGEAPTAGRPARLSPLAVQLARHLIPLIAAGALDNLIAPLIPVALEAYTFVKLSLFGVFYLGLYNGLLALEARPLPGGAARFFRENVGPLFMVQGLPIPLVLLAAAQPVNLGALVSLINAGVVTIATMGLNRAARHSLWQAQTLTDNQHALEQAHQRLDSLQRQLTVNAARLELAQHEIAAQSQHARAYEILGQLAELLKTPPERPSYEASLRLICEATGAAIGQLGITISGGANLSFVASHGLTSDRAALERATVWLEGQGLPGRALREGAALRADAATEPDYEPGFPGMQAEFCFPLLAANRRLGVLRLLSRNRDAFGPTSEAFVARAALLLALALDNTQLAGEARVRQQENAILLDSGVKLAANLDLRTIYRVIVQKLIETVNADACGLFEQDAATGLLRLAEPRGASVINPRDFPRLAHALQQTEAVVLQAEASDLAPEERALLTDHEAATLLAVPMLASTQVTGLALLYARQPRAYLASELYIAQMLANQSAVALQNARLFHHVTEGRDRLAAILDSTREGVLVINASGVISLINPPLEEFWGVSSTQLINQSLLDLVDRPELGLTAKLGLERAEIEELLLTLRAGLALSIPKRQFPVYAGKARYLERTGAPVLDQFAKAIGWVVILRDVSEERELQQMRDTLANMIVHDLRSPLTSILAGLTLMRDRLPRDQQTPLIKQSLEVALRSGNKMLGLVNTLLDISRMETGEIALARAPLSLGLLVDETMADLTPLAADQGVVLINDLPADLPPVDGDREKLMRVLVNLLDNALKFSPPGGQVSVHGERRAPAGRPAEILCVISDAGPGVPAEYLERIFGRFVQVEGQAGRRSGTGLGLAFCKLTIEAHGGRIWAENRPEGGSAFCFTLPMAL